MVTGSAWFAQVIVDTSALLAILFGEPDAGRYEKAIASAVPGAWAVALLERRVVEGRGERRGRNSMRWWRRRNRIGAGPPEQTHVARRAWRRFGKGNHPAALNFGDCFAYALARTTGEPLLSKGEDFSRDIDDA